MAEICRVCVEDLGLPLVQGKPEQAEIVQGAWDALLVDV